MLALLFEAAFRSLLLGGVVWAVVFSLRLRGTKIEAIAWKGVLVTSIAMPLLMRLSPLMIVLPVSALHVSPLTALLAVWLVINVLRAAHYTEIFVWAALLTASFTMQVAAQISAIASVAVAMPAHALPGLDFEPAIAAGHSQIASYWPQLVAAVYFGVASAMLLRLATGLFMTWGLCRRSAMVQDARANGYAVRESAEITMPGTFGATILLPQNHRAWPSEKRRAVLAHESAHVHNRDFQVQVLATIHRCVFWFSPFAWFVESRLALLAELTSDDAAVAVLGDPSAYADLLFAFATGKAPRTAIAIAKPEMITERIERILSPSTTLAPVAMRTRLFLYVAFIALVAGAAVFSPAAQTDGSREQLIHGARLVSPNPSSDAGLLTLK